MQDLNSFDELVAVVLGLWTLVARPLLIKSWGVCEFLAVSGMRHLFALQPSLATALSLKSSLV